ncbi:hypothetical protein GBAR_LOCUS12479 [Geodia barretti]|uniref:Ig-like domain-containing protein n=1 Tax=Geodia barretti TaxID=519541 RepID=A0AA35S2E7_GEOBA|nr:hypothetical protein GBAR_LOCUS12479 [Geodia barretti]
MRFSYKSAHFALVLYVLITTCSGQVFIRGNEEPLTIGLSRDLNCMWSGGGNVSTIEWFVVGLEAMAIETATETTSVVLTLTPDDDGLDGAMLLCKVTLSSGQEAEETITLSVQAIQNEVSISSMMNATAGQPYILVCTVQSERASNLSWIDPNGVACPQDDPHMTVSYIGWSEGLSTLELTFDSIRTSQSGVYKCISNIVFPSSKSEDSFLVHIQIPEPTVTILRAPEHPVQLFTNDSLVLTCVIELIPDVDSYVAINSQWRGHSSLTDSERRVIVSDLEGVQLFYNTSVTFSALKSSDSGSYTCSATVSPIEPESHLMQSHLVEETITISVVLSVTVQVTYSPPSAFILPSPPYYHPTSSVTLTCRAHHATGSVTYRWSSTCSSCFASSGTSQAISDSMLQSNDAGVHTCTVTDSNGNTGSNSTEMRLIGSGIYVQTSRNLNTAAVKNNSLVIVRPRPSCYYCQDTVVDLYCHSNATSQTVGYFRYPNGNRYSTSSDSSYYTEQRSYSGIRLYGTSSQYYGSVSIWGIFTCELTNAEGNRVEQSIGIYSSMPSAPSVYRMKYNDWSSASTTFLASVECLTQNSPPTTVTWLRDGVTVQVDGTAYEMIQTVIERQSYSRYNNTLVIKDVFELAGDHNYCCGVSNSAGTSSSQCIATTWSAQPDVMVTMPEEAIYSKPFQATCRASLQPRVAPYLTQYLTVEWMGAEGEYLTSGGAVTIEKQQTFSTAATKDLVFNPLNMTHGGNYSCEAKVVLPDSAGSFNTTHQYHLNVISEVVRVFEC